MHQENVSVPLVLSSSVHNTAEHSTLLRA